LQRVVDGAHADLQLVGDLAVRVAAGGEAQRAPLEGRERREAGEDGAQLLAGERLGDGVLVGGADEAPGAGRSRRSCGAASQSASSAARCSNGWAVVSSWCLEARAALRAIWASRLAHSQAKLPKGLGSMGERTRSTAAAAGVCEWCERYPDRACRACAPRRRRAVRLVAEGGVPVVEAARQMGLPVARVERLL
jgi:hypothetical protein